MAEGRLSDWMSLGVLASWVPRDEIEDAVEAAGKAARRRGGKLPPQVMVYFVMGLALWAEEDYEEVWAKITESLADWGGFGDDQALVTTGGLTQARQRLGYEPVQGTFELVAEPVATLDTPGAFLGKLLALSPVTLAIPGTGSLAHLEENMAASSIAFTPDDLADLSLPETPRSEEDLERSMT